MTSLSYHAEHRAWQERVLRESSSSNKFRKFATQSRSSARLPSRRLVVSNPNMLRDQAFHHMPSKYRAVLKVIDSSQSNSGRSGTQYSLHSQLSRDSNSHYSLAYHLPAEVRGKYSRPASNVSKVVSEPVLKLQEHPLLTRPVTSSDLVRKTFIDAALQVNLSRPGTSRSQGNLQPKLSTLSHNSRPSTGAQEKPPQTAGSRLSDGSKPATALPQDVANKLTEPQEVENLKEEQVAESVKGELPAEEPEGQVQEEAASPEVLPEAQEEFNRPATATTWKTTSSQRRYIDELERLLKEERKVTAT